MQSARTTNKLKKQTSLEDSSLFASPQCKQKIIQNLKLNTLFRNSKLQPIDHHQQSSNSNRLRQPANWLEQISYVTQNQAYQPKKICFYPGPEEKENIFLRSKSPHCNQQSQTNGNRNYGQKNKQSAFLEKTISHKQECFMKRMKNLGKLKKQVIVEKQAQMRHVWPKLNYTSMNQSFRKLKSINITEINSSKLSFNIRLTKSKPSFSKPLPSSVEVSSLHYQRGNDCYIPKFLRSVLQF